MDFLIIPTYNERENIGLIIPQIEQEVPLLRIVIVDDGSPDGTAHAVHELSGRFSNIELRERDGKKGLASAYLETMRWILEQYPEARTITTMDADLSHDSAMLPVFLREIEESDLVVGSRYIRGGELKNWPLVRKLLSICGNWYATRVTGASIHDLTSGFQCFRVSLLKKMDLSAIASVGFAFQMEMKIAALRAGARVKEVPITFTNRVHGVSKISNRIVYEGLISPWKLRRSYRAR